jgi:hypothetical protein
MQIAVNDTTLPIKGDLSDSMIYGALKEMRINK